METGMYLWFENNIIISQKAINILVVGLNLILKPLGGNLNG